MVVILLSLWKDARKQRFVHWRASRHFLQMPGKLKHFRIDHGLEENFAGETWIGVGVWFKRNGKSNKSTDEIAPLGIDVDEADQAICHVRRSEAP